MGTIAVSSYLAHWEVALPGILVALAAVVVMVGDLVSRGPDRDGLAALGIIGLVVAAGAAAWLWIADGGLGGFENMLRADRYALFFTMLVCAAAALTLLMSVEYLRDQPIPAGDYHALVLLATVGMVFMAAANDLIVVFLALEVMSLSVYVLAGLLRGDGRSNEAAVKYFLIGAFASAFLLYGIAFIYMAAGSTRLDVIAQAVEGGTTGGFLPLGLALLVVGFGFKLALIPFHGWAPDVYEGAPTTVTAFMAVGVKAASFAAFARVMLSAMPDLAASWSAVLWVLAACTMLIGNVLAVTQESVKRMLAYSSISHAGYALIGVVTATPAGGAALLFYLVTYTFMTVGAFAVLVALGRRGEPAETYADLAGVGFRHPGLGLAMTVCMLSLIGLPPTAGFVAKLQIFRAAVDTGDVGLAVIGVLASVVSVYYYLGVLVQMYMHESPAEATLAGSRPCVVATVVLAATATLLLGLFPAGAIEMARLSFLSLP
jgi:NADH-quinone oxidoreductase subunit N